MGGEGDTDEGWRNLEALSEAETQYEFCMMGANLDKWRKKERCA